MRTFEYEITVHASDVLQNLEYFCSPDGECTREKRPEKKRLPGFANFLTF